VIERTLRSTPKDATHWSIRSMAAATGFSHTNENPEPYRWTKSADEILASVKRFCQKTERTLCSEF
jgi:hypothetical protein